MDPVQDSVRLIFTVKNNVLDNFGGIGDPFLVLTVKNLRKINVFWLRTVENLRKIKVFGFEP